MSMNKTDLINAIAAKSGLSKKNVETFLNAFIEVVEEAFRTGESKVILVGFGTFEKKKRAAKTGRNPQTGKEMLIPETNVVVFKPGKGLKAAAKGM